MKMCGVDLTRIDVTTALVVVSEVGADTGKFPSDKLYLLAGFVPGHQNHRGQGHER
jgi:hypothetical protein